MRILFVNPVGILGGGERCLLDLIASLRQTDPSLQMGLIVSTDGPLIARSEALGVRVERLPLAEGLSVLGDSALRGEARARATVALAQGAARGIFDALGYARRLGQAIADFAPDIVHSNGMKTHVFCAAARPAAPLVWHLRDFVGQRPVASHMLRALQGRASLGVAISEAVRRDAQRVCPRLHVRVAYDAIDVEEFSPGPSAIALDELAGLRPAPAGTLRIGLLATFARWKGQDVFLDAAAEVLHRVPDVPLRFYVVGGAVYSTRDSQFSEVELRARAEALGISDAVGFVPFVQQPQHVYRALDLVVHASTRPEPFGRTIVEAMACGVPVVVAAAGGAAELFRHGVDAMGVPPSDPAKLATTLIDLLRSPGHRQELARAARGSALERFSSQRLGREMLDLYATLRRSHDP